MNFFALAAVAIVRIATKWSTLIVIALVMALPGCATMTRGTSASINVAAPACDEPVICSFRNKRGQWTVTVPGRTQVTVKRSDDPLQISCKDEDDEEFHAVAESKISGAIAQNIIWTAYFWVGMWIDAGTDASRKYPTEIVLPLCSITEEEMQVVY